jgi:hypothetical protein
VTYTGRLPGLKWLCTLWLASLAGGPFQYTGRELRDAHFDLKLTPAAFDEVAAELSLTLDQFQVPEREKGGKARQVLSLGRSIGAIGVKESVILHLPVVDGVWRAEPPRTLAG